MADSDNPPVQAVVFDLDDTLYAERDYVHSGYRAVADHIRRRLGTVTRYERYMWDLFLAGQREKIFDAAGSHFRLNLTKQQVAELVEVYRNHAPAIRAYSGAADMLARLHEQYRLGLLSDGLLPAQRLKLEALKLERFFDAVVFTEELGRDCWKPSPAGFEEIAKQLAAAASACAYVSDNPAKDFVAPNRLGWRTVQYLRPGQLHAHRPAPADGLPQQVVKSVDELLAALR